MDATSAATTIGVSPEKLALLRQNATFPPAVSDDGAGNVVFDDAAVAVFAWLYRAAIGNGWLIDDAMLSSADFVMMAKTTAEPIFFSSAVAAPDDGPVDALDFME
jgi:hypothetical protein